MRLARQRLATKADHVRVTEVFKSIQGEGVRAGTVNTFVRFAGCNLHCDGEEDDQAFAPVCDTDFASGTDYSLKDLLAQVEQVGGTCRNIVFTGGEPALQLTQDVVDAFKEKGYYLAIETNGTIELPCFLNWVCVSPKTAEHTLAMKECEELKYVRHVGQAIPKPRMRADHYLISPAFEADGSVRKATLDWCMGLVLQEPRWRLSLQLHKFLRVR